MQRQMISIFIPSDPHHGTFSHLFSCHGEKHVAMVVSFVALILFVGSSGLGLLFCVREFVSGCRQGLQLASKCYPVTTCHAKRHTHKGIYIYIYWCIIYVLVFVCCGFVFVVVLWMRVLFVCCVCVLWLCVCGCVLWMCVVVVCCACVM